MSGIFDQIINYSPPLIVSGTVNYKGTWNASTNNPTLNSSPAASTKGDYYVVSTAGTQFGITFAIGDWIISNGTAWEKVDLTDAVSSVFGRTGAVVGVSTDYSAVGLTNTAIGASNPSTGAFTTVTASSTIAATGAVTGSNLSGTNTGDQTTITGNAGTATVLQTPRAIYGNNFDGSAALTQVIASTYGGTGNGFAKFSGPASSEKTFTLPNASSTLLYDGGALGTPSSGTVTNLTGTASININGTVGATTPSTGAFTTGKLSDVLSLSGFATPPASGASLEMGYQSSGSNGLVQAYDRTANAWRALNLSASTTNILSSGSTVGAFSSTGLAVTGALSATGSIKTADTQVIGWGTGNVGFIGSAASNYLRTYINSSLVGEFTSTGLAVTGALSSTTGANFATSSGSVGIGTTSFAGSAKFQVAGGRSYFGSNSSLYAICAAYNDTRAQAGQGYYLGSTDSATPDLAFSNTDGTERVRITYAGNVGIGTTSPVTLYSSPTLQVYGNTKLGNANDRGLLSLGDVSSTGANVAIWRGAAGAYGAAGNVLCLGGYDGITFTTGNTGIDSQTERMRITSTGNVGIGTSSPTTKLHVDQGADGNGITLAFSGRGASRINWDMSGTTNEATTFFHNNGTNRYVMQQWSRDYVSFYSNNTERARIDSSGYVGIGTSSNLQPLGVGNASANTLALLRTGVAATAGNIGPSINFYLAQSSTTSQTGDANLGRITASPIDGWGSYLQFFTKSADGVPGNAVVERARIDSSGGLRINTTTYIGNSGEILTVNGDGDTSFFRTTNGGGGGTALHVNRSASNGNFLYFTYGTGLTNVGSISYNGTLTVFSTTSDYRLKDITGPLTDSGAFIDSLKPKVGTWKSNGSKFVGFVAHEFAEVCPSAVTGEKDAVDSDGKPVYQGMQAGTAEVIANLVAELQSVRQRLAALEA